MGSKTNGMNEFYGLLLAFFLAYTFFVLQKSIHGVSSTTIYKFFG
jgi:hypothetical protein